MKNWCISLLIRDYFFKSEGKQNVCFYGRLEPERLVLAPSKLRSHGLPVDTHALLEAGVLALLSSCLFKCFRRMKFQQIYFFNLPSLSLINLFEDPLAWGSDLWRFWAFANTWFLYLGRTQ